MMAHALIPALRKPGLADLFEFEASLVYIASSRAAQASEIYAFCFLIRIRYREMLYWKY